MKERVPSLKEKRVALKAAFPHTLPVMTGFLFLGMAYGILMDSKGYGPGWAFLFSFIAFAGSAQYMAVTFLTSAFNPLYALMMTLMINARHLFYGISMLDRYKGMGRVKPYLIFGLCDETFSVICATEPPAGVSSKWFRFFITALHHFYWVGGSVLGGFFGSMVSFNTKGLDFALTALFVVIFLGQWKAQKNHKPALIGLGATTLCLMAFGLAHFIIPSMAAIIVILTIFRKQIKNPPGLPEEAEEEIQCL